MRLSTCAITYSAIATPWALLLQMRVPLFAKLAIERMIQPRVEGLQHADRLAVQRQLERPVAKPLCVEMRAQPHVVERDVARCNLARPSTRKVPSLLKVRTRDVQPERAQPIADVGIRLVEHPHCHRHYRYRAPRLQIPFRVIG